MASLDLDARRAARAEVTGEPHEVTLGGEVYQFQPLIPLEALELMTEAHYRAAFRLMLVAKPGTEDAMVSRFFANLPDETDLDDIVKGLYRQRPGESSASPASSANGGRPSRQTLPATTTDSAWPRPATAPGQSAHDDS
jgi:hypothetical protein